MTAPDTKAGRFEWLDAMKGLAILWIVLFHCCTSNEVFKAYPWVLGPSYLDRLMAQTEGMTALASMLYLARGAFVAIVELGFHGVGLFLIASGFGLSFSQAKSDAAGNWWTWYGKRLIRLYPMYWVAHLIFLVSPFVFRPEPIDYRFLISLTGLRIYPLDMTFYYANPAWWFFTLLIQLYLAFPVLHYLHRKIGPAGFLVLCALLTFGVRYLLLCVTPVNGSVVQGAFFVCRLMEFATGMALGRWARQDPQRMEQSLFRIAGLITGIVVYGLGVASYRTLPTYAFSDALTGIGLFIILAHLCRFVATHSEALFARLAFVGSFSYGLYLIHQPYVLYAGDKMRNFGLLAFVALTVVIIAAITAVSVPLEKAVNGLVSRITAQRAKPG